jgi:hypothetical protein
MEKENIISKKLGSFLIQNKKYYLINVFKHIDSFIIKQLMRLIIDIIIITRI